MSAFDPKRASGTHHHFQKFMSPILVVANLLLVSSDRLALQCYATPARAIGMTDLVLVSAKESRGGGDWSRDDYDVRLGDASGRVVGKIFKAVMAPDDLSWLWTITERTPRKLTDRGYAATLEEAMEAFKSAWASTDETSR